jgi:hypothetical protein
MSIRSYLGRFRRRAKPAVKARRPRPSLGLEILEDRLVPATVTIANNVLTYQAASNVATNLTISHSGSTYNLADDSVVSKVDSNSFDQIEVKLGDKNNSVTVLSSDVYIHVDGGAGDDIVTVGGGGQGMELVTARVDFDGGTQTTADKLVLSDRNAPVLGPVGAQQTLAYSAGGGAVTRERLDYSGKSLGFVTHSSSNVEEVDLNTSDQSDTIGVSSVPAGTTLVINARAGDDTVTVNSMDLLAGSLFVNGQDGTDTLIVDDRLATTDRNYVINTDKVSQGAATVNLDTLEGLTIEASNNNKANSFDIQSTNALMPLTIVGGTGRDTLTLDDTALPKGIQTYNFNAGSLERWTSFVIFAVPTAYVYYSGIEKMIVDAGQSDDTFKMTETKQPKLVIDGGGGRNTLDYSAYTSGVGVTVNLTDGTVDRVSKLSNVENIIGTQYADILVGDANANSIQGTGGRDLIIGGLGADTLDGGADEDILIGGTTAYDTIDKSLQAISTAWNGPGKTLSRFTTLNHDGVGFGNLIKLDSWTVTNDTDKDVMTGDDPSSPGSDWFFADSALDVLTDYSKSSDFLT